MLEEVFERWDDLLASLSEKQIAAQVLHDNWSVKDVISHLWAWQQASLARAEAALQGNVPEYPEWWRIFGPDPEEDVDRTNAWIYETYRDKSWSSVYKDWKSQFLRYLVLIKEIPEQDLLEQGKYEWMGGYSLSASALGSLEHHQEHLEALSAWLRKRGILKTGD